MVGNLYREGSHLKDKAYLIFYMGINVGALLAPLVASFIQPRWGFHPAFFMGAIGMVISLIVFGITRSGCATPTASAESEATSRVPTARRAIRKRSR